jgi:hypothetical protein
VTNEPKIPAQPLERLVRQERERQAPGHLTAERLAAYRAGELGPGEVEEVQEHLTFCRECAQALLELARFSELMEAEESTANESAAEGGETAASWQALRARLGPELTGAPPAETVSRFRRLTTSRVTVLALAAGLFACLIGFPLWMATHHAGGPSSPLVLYPPPRSEISRGLEESGPFLSVNLTEAAVLVLPIQERPSFPAYRIEIQTPGGELRLSTTATPVPVASPPGGYVAGPGEVPPPQLLTVALARGQLAPGEYRLRIVGLRGGRGEILAEKGLRVGGESRYRPGT